MRLSQLPYSRSPIRDSAAPLLAALRIVFAPSALLPLMCGPIIVRVYQPRRSVFPLVALSCLRQCPTLLRYMATRNLTACRRDQVLCVRCAGKDRCISSHSALPELVPSSSHPILSLPQLSKDLSIQVNPDPYSRDRLNRLMP